MVRCGGEEEAEGRGRQAAEVGASEGILRVGEQRERADECGHSYRQCVQKMNPD